MSPLGERDWDIAQVEAEEAIDDLIQEVLEDLADDRLEDADGRRGIREAAAGEGAGEESSFDVPYPG